MMAVHTCPAAAAAFDSAAQSAGDGGWASVLPAALAEVAALLQSGEVRWASGLRIGCGLPPFPFFCPRMHSISLEGAWG